MSFKPRVEIENKDSFKIDWDKVNAQVRTGGIGARVSLIVDLGIQPTKTMVLLENASKEVMTTTFNSEEEAEDFKARAAEIEPKVENLPVYRDSKGKWAVDCFMYKPKPTQEVAIFLDNPSNIIDYGDGTPRPYRIAYHGEFKGEISGISIGPVRKNGETTFCRKLNKLLEAARLKEVMDEKHPNYLDLSLLLNRPLYANLKENYGKKDKTQKFIQLTAVGEPMDGVVLPELPDTVIPMVISFDNVTVDMLEKAKLRKSLVEKIKQSTEYGVSESGKRMKAVLEEYEERFGKRSSNEDDQGEYYEEEHQDGPEEGDVQAKDVPWLNVGKEEKKTPLTVHEEPENDDNDIPF